MAIDDTTTIDRPSRDQTGIESEERSDEEERRLSTDTVFTILKNRRRREVLRRLRDRGGEQTHRELAEQIAAAENGVDRDRLSSKQRKRVYISLYQCHLPKLADAGVVDYDSNRGEVELRPAAAACFRYLDRLDGLEESEGHGDRLWAAGGTVVAVGMLAGLLLPAVPLGLGALVGTGFLLAFAVTVAMNP